MDRKPNEINENLIPMKLTTIPEYKISIQIWLAIYRKCHLAFNHPIPNVQ